MSIRYESCQLTATLFTLPTKATPRNVALLQPKCKLFPTDLGKSKAQFWPIALSQLLPHLRPQFFVSTSTSYDLIDKSSGTGGGEPVRVGCEVEVAWDGIMGLMRWKTTERTGAARG